MSRYYPCTGEGQVGIAAIGGGNTGTRALFAAEASSGGCDDCLVGTWQQRVERGPGEGFVTLFEPWGAVALIAGGYRFTSDERVADAMTMTVTYDHPGPHLEMRPDGGFLYSDPRLVVFEGESDEGWARDTTYFAVDGIAGRWQSRSAELEFQGEERLRAGQFRAETSAENLGLIDLAFNEPRDLGPAHRLAVQAICRGPLLTLERTLPDGTARVEYFERLP